MTRAGAQSSTWVRLQDCYSCEGNVRVVNFEADASSLIRDYGTAILQPLLRKKHGLSLPLILFDSVDQHKHGLPVLSQPGVATVKHQGIAQDHSNFIRRIQ